MSTELVSDSIARFLNLRRLPARLNVEQTAARIGFEPEHIPVLIRGGLLKPIGNPAKNGPKLFASAEIEKKCQDSDWVEKAQRCLTRYYAERNRKGKTLLKPLGKSCVAASEEDGFSQEAA